MFGLIWVLLGLKHWFFAFLGVMFNVSVSASVFVGGLSEVTGYYGGVAVTESYGVDVVILLPMFFVLVGAISLYYRFWGGR